MPAAMQMQEAAEEKKKTTEGKSNDRQGKATPFFQVSLSHPKAPPPRPPGASAEAEPAAEEGAYLILRL